MTATTLDFAPASSDQEQFVVRRLSDFETFGILREHGDHPSIALAANEGMLHFTHTRRMGLIAYHEIGRYFLQVGGICAAHEDRELFLNSFLEMASARGKRVLVVQLREQDVELYRRAGFRINSMGCSYTLDIRDYSLAGKHFMKLRNKIRQPAKFGVEIGEIGREVSRSHAKVDVLDAISQDWLKKKGERVKMLSLLVGESASINRPGTRCFLAIRDGQPIGFISYVPAFGRYEGYMHDLTRKVPDAPAGTMELINHTAIERFRSENVSYLNFGFTPFVGARDPIEGSSRFVGAVTRALERWGDRVYPAQSQVTYKMKWGPQHIEQEYVAYKGRFRLRDVWALLRATNSV